MAPIPGETKIWQYIKLSKNVLMIDCPGVIHQSDDPNDTHQAVLKGVVRVERMEKEVCNAVRWASRYSRLTPETFENRIQLLRQGTGSQAGITL